MDQLLQWFGEARYAGDLARARRFWAGEGRYLVSLAASEPAYRQIFDDQKILTAAPRQLEAQARLPGINLPTFFADFGTISTARYWGGEVRPPRDGAMIYIEPAVQTIDDALAATHRPVDDPEMDAARAMSLYRRLGEMLQTNALWLRTPDMQGPLNTAGLIMNQEEMFMAMFGEPAKVHAFLEKVCEFLIDYQRHLRRATSGRICGNIWPYTFFPAELGVSFTEDLMPLLSVESYAEFGIPCLRRMQEALGALHIHCCGSWGRHAPTLQQSGLDIKAVEFHYPFTRIEELETLAGEAVLIPYIVLHQQTEFGSLAEYCRHLLKHAGKSHRFWFAFPDDSAENRAFVEEFGASGN